MYSGDKAEGIPNANLWPPQAAAHLLLDLAPTLASTYAWILYIYTCKKITYWFGALSVQHTGPHKHYQ